MMKKSVLIKYNSVFLAMVLVTGIIAVSSTSFMMGANAQQEYGMDHYKKKVKVEKIKCNNDNFNINVLNPDILPELNNDLQKLTKSNKESNKWVEDDKIILICSNYNDPVKFRVAQQEQNDQPIVAQQEQNDQPIVAQQEQNDQPIVAQPEDIVGCEECLQKLNTNLQRTLITSIANLPNPIIQIGGITIDFTGITETSTLGDICSIIDEAVQDNGPIQMTEMIATFNDLLPNLDTEGQDQVAEVILYLLNAKILENDVEMTAD